MQRRPFLPGHGTVPASPFGLAGPKGMDPAVLEWLHDALGMALDDPKIRPTFDRDDRPTASVGPGRDTARAKKTYEAERATIARVGLKGSIRPPNDLDHPTQEETTWQASSNSPRPTATPSGPTSPRPPASRAAR